MCGICGFAGNGSRDDIKRMSDAMRLRGPDAEGFWHAQQSNVFLGHRRLSILDIQSGAQPMLNPEGDIVIVFNGEIYNHADLRNELQKRGHKFVTDHSDTETLIHGFEEWGEALPQKLNGMWAFAIFDIKNNKLFLSRDRFGKKPLYYTLSNGVFAFASELNALEQHSSLKFSVSVKALQKYFAYGYIPAPNSIYENVYKLPGGHSMFFDLDSKHISIRKYWEFMIEPFETIPSNPEAEWGGRIIELLENAVRRRLEADVPVGIFLSGGVDSTAVTAMAVRAKPGNVKTFSIGFEEASFDESSFASEAAKYFGTEHTCEIMSMEKAAGLSRVIAENLDEPMGDSSILPCYMLSEITRKHVTVALGGDGGDELFAGYDPFRALKAATAYSRFVPGVLHEGIRQLFALMPVSHKNMSLDFKIKTTLKGLSYQNKFWMPVWMSPIDPRDLNELFRMPLDVEDLYSEAVAAWDAQSGTDIVDKTMQFFVRLYMQDGILTKVDRASMMHSLEARSPFLDIELVDFVRRIPWQYKYRNGVTKYILKKALSGLIPESLIYRKKKGFGVPVGKWFREGKLNVDGLPPHESASIDFTKKLIADHISSRKDNRLSLWNLKLLQDWGKKHPAGAPIYQNLSNLI